MSQQAPQAMVPIPPTEGMASTTALSCGPCGDGAPEIRIPMGATHRIVLGRAHAARLVDAVLDPCPLPGSRLIILGQDVGALREDERRALRARVALLPADGGLISHLNGWENIVLPIGFHNPERMPGIADRVFAMARGFVAATDAWLEKRPEHMTLYEKKVAACVRMLLEAPDLVLAEDLFAGLERPAEREQVSRFASAYRAALPGGTFVQLDVVPDE